MAETVFDDKKPVVFNLPDGDVAKLITWSFVEYKLDEALSDTLNQIESINSHLTRINNRVDEWLDEQSTI